MCKKFIVFVHNHHRIKFDDEYIKKIKVYLPLRAIKRVGTPISLATEALSASFPLLVSVVSSDELILSLPDDCKMPETFGFVKLIVLFSFRRVCAANEPLRWLVVLELPVAGDEFELVLVLTQIPVLADRSAFEERVQISVELTLADTGGVGVSVMS